MITLIKGITRVMTPELLGLKPYFQKQFNEKKETVSAEILMRSPLGEISEIVRVLERKDKIHELDLLAFYSAVRWHERYQLPCASNFSGKSLSRKRVLNTIAVEGCVSKIKIELTENRYLNPKAIAHIEELNGLGFQLSLDDYGSKWNGVNRLSDLPIKEIKLDQHLISKIDRQKTREIVRSTIDLGNKINCSVVAEGVEDQQTFDILLSLGCTRFQGFFLHEPEEFN